MRGISSLVRSNPRRSGTVAFCIAALASIAYVLWLGRGGTLILDEWSYLVQARISSAGHLLDPHNGHLIVFPLLVLKAMYSTFGLTSHLPYQLLAVLLNVLNAALLYVFARRRLDPFTALVPALLILFCGGGWDAFVSSYQLPNLISIAAGLSALLLIGRGDLRGDVLACLALAISLASVTVGVAFAAGIAVALLLRGREGALRRAWVFLVPAIPYAAWFLWSMHLREGEVTAGSVGALGSGIFDQLAAIFAAMTGLAVGPEVGNIAAPAVSRPSWGPVLVLLAVVAVAIALRRRRPSPFFYVAFATLSVYLVTVALALGHLRSADTSRYIYMGSPLVLLVLIEAFRGLRPSRGWAIGIVVALFFSLLASGALMGVGGKLVRAESATNRAQLAALEIAREEVPEDFVVEAGGVTTASNPDMLFDAGTFFEISDSYGSPAYSEGELESSPEGAREAADLMLARALPISVRPGFRPGSGAPIEVSEGDEYRRAPRGCVTVVPEAGAEARVAFEVPDPGFAYRPLAGVAPRIGLRRFADGFVVAPALPQGPARVTIPSDGSQRPWQAEVVTASRLLVCP